MTTRIPHLRSTADLMGRLREAVAGDAAAPLVLAGNFEVELEWAKGQARLPTVSSAASTAIVNRMDEFALLLGTGRDTVLLKAPPDPDYLEHLQQLGFELPAVHVVAGGSADRSVTADALADPATLAALRQAGERGARLLPHGTSDVEQQLAQAAGIPLATAPADTCRLVNSKVLSRRLCDEHGITQPTGRAATTPQELADAVEAAVPWLAHGKVVVKEAFGVSGKGIAVVESPERLRRVLTIVQRQAAKGLRVDFTVEQWVDKQTDLNYQVSVDASGQVRLDTVKVALTEGGVHRGHRMPAGLSRAHTAQLEHAGQVVGQALHRLGYTGIIGIDALIERDGTLHPVIEINARNNMSTYQVGIQSHLIPPGHVALAKHYPLTLAEPLRYRSLREQLADLMLAAPGGSGLVVNNFATVNAAFATPDGGASRPGRLYAVLVARSTEQLRALDGSVTDRLAQKEVAA